MTLQLFHSLLIFLCFQKTRLSVRVAAGESLPVFPVLHHSAVFIFIFLGIIELILISWKIEFCLSLCLRAFAALQTTLLRMKSPKETDTPIFIILFVIWYRYITHLYCLAVEADFRSDVVSTRLRARRENFFFVVTYVRCFEGYPLWW